MFIILFVILSLPFYLCTKARLSFAMLYLLFYWQLGVIQSISNNSNMSNKSKSNSNISNNSNILIMIMNILSSYIIIMKYILFYDNCYILPTVWALSIFFLSYSFIILSCICYSHLFIFIFANCQLPFSYSQVPHFMIQIQAESVFIV